MGMREFRAAYPQYNDVSDDEVLDRVRKQQFSGLSDAEWEKKTARLRTPEPRVAPKGIRKVIPRTRDMNLMQTDPRRQWEGELHEQLQGAVASGTMRLGGALLKLPAAIQGGLKQLDPDLDVESGPFGKNYHQLIKEHDAGVKAIMADHPEWEYDPPENFADMVSDPRHLMLSLAESAPVMVGAGVLTAAGAPHLGLTMMFAAEGQEAKDEAISYGASIEDANTAYFVYGSVAAVIEQMQLKGVMKLGKKAYHQALNRSARKVIQGGLSLKKETLKTVIRESVEEMAQGAWQEQTAKMVYDRPIEGGKFGWIDRRLQEGYVGGAMGLVGATGGHMAGKAKQKLNRMGQAKQDFADRLSKAGAPTVAPTFKERPIGQQRADVNRQANDLGFNAKEKEQLIQQVTNKDKLSELETVDLEAVNEVFDTLRDLENGQVKPRDPSDVPDRDKPEWAGQAEFGAWKRGEMTSMGVADASLESRGFFDEEGMPAEGTSISERAREVSPIQARREATEMLAADLDGLTTDYITGPQRVDRPFANPKWLINFRPTWRIINDTGLSPVLDRPLRARIDYEYDLHNTTNQIKTKIKQMNKVADTSVSERLRRKVKNEPTEVEKYMVRSLNEFEDAPVDMPDDLVPYFNYFRDLSRDTLLRENMARMTTNLPVIPNRKAYFRHVLNTDAAEMVQGLRPFPAKLQYWAEKLYGRRFKNSMEIERTIDKVSEDLWDLFSDDMDFVMSSMVRTAFREVYLNDPVKKAYAMISRFQPSEQELLSLGINDPGELRHYEMPKQTRDFAEEFIKVMIRDEQTNLDEHLNTAFRDSKAGKLIDRTMHKFGRSLSRRPLSELNLHLTTATRMGVLGMRPKLLIRNKFQLTQLLGLYPSTDVMHAFGKTPAWLKPIMEDSQFLRTYTGLEDAPADFIGKAERMWQGAYMKTAVSNARQAFKVAAYGAREMVLNPKYREHGWADPRRTDQTADGYLFPSEVAKIEKEAEWGAKATQYQYLGATMPWIYRNKSLRFATQLQSWWMNHFFNFHEEAFHRLRTGRPAWSNGEVTLPMKYRMGMLRYLTVGGLVLTSLGYSSSFLMGVAPKGWPPLSQFLVSLYNYFTGAEQHRQWRKREMLNALKTMIPGYVAYKDVRKAWETGEWITMFKYTQQEKDTKSASEKDAWGGTRVPKKKKAKEPKGYRKGKW
jgi:hypothetical protein